MLTCDYLASVPSSRTQSQFFFFAVVAVVSFQFKWQTRLASNPILITSNTKKKVEINTILL